VPFALFSQTSLDSLLKVTANMVDDSAKVMNLIAITNKYRVEKIDYPNAKKYVLQAVDLADKINFAKGNFIATIAYGYLTRDLSKTNEALELLKSAIKIYESNKNLLADKSLRITYIYTYTALADLYTSLPNYTLAQEYAFKGLALAEKYNIGSGQCWLTLSIIFSKQKNLVEANKYALKAVAYFKQFKKLDNLARAYAFLARYAYTLEDYNTAINYYLSTYDTYKQVNSLFGMRIALYNLSEIYLKTSNYEKANYYINETLKINSVSADDIVYQYYINQLKFTITLDSKNYKEAIDVANLLLDFAKKEKNKQKISSAYVNLFTVYMAKKDTINAFIFSEKISALKDSLYNTEITKSTADLAKKYETEKQKQQIEFLDKENKLNQEKLLQETKLGFALKSENLLKEDKLLKEGLLRKFMFNENALIDNQLKQKAIIQKVLESENQLKNRELKKGIQLNETLQSQNKLMVKNSANESLIRWLMIILLTGGVIFGINYYRNFQQQKINNVQIVKQSEELKVLMSELHHRVKNNLQVVVSMLRMQARGINNKEAVEALVNSENRLQAIAMVHEKLYKSGNLKEVLLKDYLTELMDVLMQQHLPAQSNLQYHLDDSTNLSTSLDTAIPIGLIVNELVTNSFKHAFDSTVNGKINIGFQKLPSGQYQLIVSDNGKGFPNGVLPDKIDSLGLKLIKLFTEQLNGVMHYEFNKGSNFKIGFNLIGNL
jgi:two-component sensor histidine kinase/tetratricopeptide (TPR) repeat protein